MIRRYIDKDIPVLVQIVRTSISNTAHKHMTVNEQKLLDLLIGNLNNERVFCDVVVEDDVIVGVLFATINTPLFTDDTVAFDHLLYIDPTSRRGKVATALVVNYVEWARKCGVKRVQLSNSMGGNVEAFTAFAEANGFKQTGSIHAMEF